MKISVQSSRPVINPEKKALKVATFVISFSTRHYWGWNPGNSLSWILLDNWEKPPIPTKRFQEVVWEIACVKTAQQKTQWESNPEGGDGRAVARGIWRLGGVLKCSPSRTTILQLCSWKDEEEGRIAWSLFPNGQMSQNWEIQKSERWRRTKTWIHVCQMKQRVI